MAQGKQKLHIGSSFVIRIEPNDNGGFRFHAEGPNGDGRFLEITDGGGHIHLSCPGSITINTGLQLDSGNHAIFHLE